MAKILIVDDSDVVRGQLKNLLLNDGHEVIECSDGLAGLNAAKAEAVELIVTDLNMPHMNGLQMAREIRQLPQHSKTFILMLTTETSVGLKKQGKEIGVRSWIVKPLNEDVMRNAVNTLLKVA